MLKKHIVADEKSTKKDNRFIFVVRDDQRRAIRLCCLSWLCFARTLSRGGTGHDNRCDLALPAQDG